MQGEAGAGALLGEAQEALEAGRWPAAKEAFEAALADEESPEALFGLGTAQWWLGETESSVRYRERAFAAFRRRPDPAQATLAAVHLCYTYSASFGNHAAAGGWLARAASLVSEHRLAPLVGWVQLCRAAVANDTGKPREAEAEAREAREAARRTADADLELCALSELGAALVELGRVEEGAALLDEAMAGALGGEGESLDTVVLTSCRTVTACSRAAELKRAVQWIRAADEFHRRYGSPHLYTTCRTAYGGVLFATGRWTEAEHEFHAALKIGKAAEPALYAEALARLAELRLAQGRLEEAERLLAGFEEHAATACALGAIHIARGEPAVASSILRRRLREVGDECLEGAIALELQLEAELERGSSGAVTARGRRLAELGVSLGCDAIVARGERALGRCLAAAGEADAAIPHLEAALSAFGRLEMPLEIGRTRLLLARALAGREREAAIAAARGALSGFEELGAEPDADAAAGFLRSLGVRAARSGPKGTGVLTKREREVLVLLGEGLANREIAERLFITRKTVEHHVARVLSKLELRGRGEAAAYAVRNPDRESATK
jgi:DNA-binding CsgD family transcriptional regulator